KFMEINLALLLAGLVFAGTYLAIMFEIYHRTTAALTGAVLMFLVGWKLGFLTWDEAIEAIDFEVIGLLLGMMIIVAVLARTGAFSWLGVKIIKTTKGDLWKVLILFAIVTAVISAFIDNVTTVLLITPPLIEISAILGFNPAPFLITQALASNVGGTATLVGDPPNVMIASAAHLTFMDFIWYQGKPTLAPIIIVVMLASIPAFRYISRGAIKQKINSDVITGLSEEGKITNKSLLWRCLFALGLVIGMFIFQKQLGLGIGIIALTGAAFLLVITKGIRPNIVELLHHVEWPVLLFFAGLFVVVGGAEKVGLITIMANAVANVVGNNLLLATGVIIWTMAFASAIVDNIPITAAMIPLVYSLSETTGLPIAPLWWALALGVCLGGNGTLIGASANVVVAGICDKLGKPITFKEFTRMGMPFMIFTVAVSHILFVLIWII
ncbi:MAG: ArsB/NhaD family transporter, partial [Euryarchaeota archaeon]|nr:ArsB/NhaD family transporter [Euryarchaeota archaeon]